MAQLDRFERLIDSLLPRIANYGIDLLVALIVLLAGWWLARRLAGAVVGLVVRAGGDATAAPLIGTAVMWGVRILTLVNVLARLGIQTTSIVAALGAAGLAIGLALQGTLQNIAAGLMLLLLRPFRAGDYIEGSGTIAGTVREVGLFSTHLGKLDGVSLYVPNSQLWSNAVTNFSRNPTRRIEVAFQVSVAQIEPGLQLLRELIAAEPRILSEPAPTVLVADYTDAGAKLALQAWVINADYTAVRAELLRSIRPRLEAQAEPQV
ncbi:mechanosensitive ion channel family protein [Chitiniphilus purpureus]|uniref:Small-conductance mechanosensitive channel n=1 Tax=Chitiniphilus purpureus TaxID=2981137 RepID=A0ABY6DJV2_9NEIS|nr:mechanosensitive ion channel family protein [Chitiniphilus sp. CD1]UXY14640.1 mechanosensitive ion channel family protein [Chitiniphilus sp. CD1]